MTEYNIVQGEVGFAVIFAMRLAGKVKETPSERKVRE